MQSHEVSRYSLSAHHKVCPEAQHPRIFLLRIMTFAQYPQCGGQRTLDRRYAGTRVHDSSTPDRAHRGTARYCRAASPRPARTSICAIRWRPMHLRQLEQVDSQIVFHNDARDHSSVWFRVARGASVTSVIRKRIIQDLTRNRTYLRVRRMRRRPLARAGNAHTCSPHAHTPLTSSPVHTTSNSFVTDPAPHTQCHRHEHKHAQRPTLLPHPARPTPRPRVGIRASRRSAPTGHGCSECE